MSGKIKNSILKTTALTLVCGLLFSSCAASESLIESETNTIREENSNLISIGASKSSITDEVSPGAKYSEFDLNTEAGSETVYITLNDTDAKFDSKNASLNDGVLFISGAGDYELSGDFNGQICVNAGIDDNVHLIFNGVTLTSAMAPLNIVNAKNVSITLAEGSVNSVTDSSDYTFEDDEDEPNAAIFSKCDLTINGTGELTVNGQYECGIRSKDDLIIVNGNITVYSVGDAIKGKDSLVIKDGIFTIQSNADGLKSNNDKDADRGYVIIENGTFDITVADDGIHAETWLQIYDGNITVNESYEALEGKKVEIYGGNLYLTASDDGINAASGNSSNEADDSSHFDKGNKRFDFGDTFDNGKRKEPSEVHGDGTMPEMPNDGTMPEMPNGGTMPEMPNDGTMPEMPNDMTVPEMPDNMSEYGMEERFREENSAGWGMFGGGKMGGGFNEAPEDGVYILIAGGTIRVQAGNDVIDSNGTFEQTGGTVITVAPSMTVCGQPDCVIDVNGDAFVNGGTFISLARNIGSVDSLANVPGFALSSSGADSGEKLTIIDADGNTVFEFTPEVSSSVILVISDLLTVDETYVIKYGETSKTFTATKEIITIQ